VATLTDPSVEVYSAGYAPMRAFQDALTADVAAVAGCDLVPTYSYFRLYPKGARCRVHADRPACEHSVSLMLAQGSGIAWPLEIAIVATAPSAGGVSDDFGGADHISLPMSAGDGVVYRGVTHRHGRITPNPNAWSAHLFLHWVDPSGPYAAHADDAMRRTRPSAVTG